MRIGYSSIIKNLQKNIETQIASMIIRCDVFDGQTVVIDKGDEKLEFSVK